MKHLCALSLLALLALGGWMWKGGLACRAEKAPLHASLALLQKPGGEGSSEEPDKAALAKAKAIATLLALPQNEPKARPFWRSFCACFYTLVVRGDPSLDVPAQDPWLLPMERFFAKGGWPEVRFLCARRVVAEGGEPFVLAAFVHQLDALPGNGWILYFWFCEDGTLEGSGVMSAGWRRFLEKFEVLGNAGATQVELVANGMGGLSPQTVRMVLKKEGLQGMVSHEPWEDEKTGQRSTGGLGSEIGLPLLPTIEAL